MAIDPWTGEFSGEFGPTGSTGSTDPWSGPFSGDFGPSGGTVISWDVNAPCGALRATAQRDVLMPTLGRNAVSVIQNTLMPLAFGGTPERRDMVSPIFWRGSARSDIKISLTFNEITQSDYQPRLTLNATTTATNPWSGEFSNEFGPWYVPGTILPFTWSVAGKSDIVIPVTRNSIPRIDLPAPITWGGTIVAITKDVLLPFAWSAAIRADAGLSLTTSAATRKDVPAALQIGATLRSDEIAVAAWGALLRLDRLDPASWTTAWRADVPMGLHWLAAGRLDLIDLIAWVGGAVIVAGDVLIPLTWGVKAQREDISAALSYTTGIRFDTVSPFHQGAASRRDLVIPITWGALTRARDTLFPVSWLSTVSYDPANWISWSGSTFPIAGPHFNPLAWSTTLSSDTITPVSWKGSANPISADYLTPFAWGASTQSDTKPTLAAGARFFDDTLTPVFWRQVAVRDLLTPFSWLSTAVRRAPSPIEDRATARVDEFARIFWSGSTINVFRDSLAPLAWAGSLRADAVAWIASSAGMRRDVLIPIPNAGTAPSRLDVSMPLTTTLSLRRDVLNPLATRVAERIDYVLPLTWIGMTYAVGLDYVLRLTWSAPIYRDVVAKLGEGSAPVRADFAISLITRRTSFTDSVIPTSAVSAGSRDTTFPVAFGSTPTYATSYDVSAALAWLSAEGSPQNIPIAGSASLRTDLLIPALWGGQRPFIPSPGRIATRSSADYWIVHESTPPQPSFWFPPLEATDEVAPFTYDATTLALGDVIVAASFTARPSGDGEVVASLLTVAGALVTVWLSGGVPGRTYTYQLIVTTAGGRVLSVLIGQVADPLTASSLPLPPPQFPGFGSPITWNIT